MLQKAWASTAPSADPAQKTNIVVLHAIGGAGKTALMRHFVDGLADGDFAGAAKVYGWSAYSQGSGDNKTANADEFIARALGFFGHDLARHPIQDAVERGRKLARLVAERHSLLILDGLEPLQDPPVVNKGRLKDRALAALIKELAAHNKGLLVITSRQELPELEAQRKPRVVSHPLDRLGSVAGVALLAHLGVHGKRSEMEKAVEDVLGHALSLNLLGTYLDAVHGGDVNQREQFKLGEIEDAPADLIGDQTKRYAKRAARIMEGTIARFEELEGRTAAGGDAETAILHMVGLFDRPAEKDALDALLAEPPIPGLTDAFFYQPLTPRPLPQGEREPAGSNIVPSPLAGEGQGEGESANTAPVVLPRKIRPLGRRRGPAAQAAAPERGRRARAGQPRRPPHRARPFRFAASTPRAGRLPRSAQPPLRFLSLSGSTAGVSHAGSLWVVSNQGHFSRRPY